MKPIEFEGQNTVFAEHQPEYLPLPAHVLAGNQGTTTFCWKLTWRERLKVLRTGKLWHQVLTFKQPLQPQMITAEKPRFSCDP